MKAYLLRLCGPSAHYFRRISTRTLLTIPHVWCAEAKIKVKLKTRERKKKHCKYQERARKDTVNKQLTTDKDASKDRLRRLTGNEQQATQCSGSTPGTILQVKNGARTQRTEDSAGQYIHE